MPVCVDACFILLWLVPQQTHPRVYELVDGWIEDGVEFVGPGLLFAEVVSVIRHKVSQRVFEAKDGEEIVRLFLRLGIRRIEHQNINRRAYELATRFGHGRAYDAHYLAAAEAERCDLWTADGPLYRSVKDDMRWVKHVSLL